MRHEQKVEFILDACRPSSRKRRPLFGIIAERILGGLKRDRDKGVGSRALEARQELNENIHFLAGVLTILPFLNLRRGIQLKDDGGKILGDAFSFRNTCEPTTAQRGAPLLA